MKKVILSLVIGGLSISGDCLASNDFATASSKQNNQNRCLVEVKSAMLKAGIDVKEAIQRKNVQVALGTSVIGIGVAAYCFVPGVSNLVNLYAKAALIKGIKATDKGIKATNALWNRAEEYAGLNVVSTPTKWEKAKRVAESLIAHGGKSIACYALVVTTLSVCKTIIMSIANSL